MNIPDVMRSVSEVLTTAEELLEDGDADREVSFLLMSFLKTLLVDLDKVVVEQGPTGVNPRPRKQPRKTRTPNARNVKVTKTKQRIRNKYESQCARCDKPLAAGEGWVLPAADPNASKKWFAFCDPDYDKEIA